MWFGLASQATPKKIAGAEEFYQTEEERPLELCYVTHFRTLNRVAQGFGFSAFSA